MGTATARVGGSIPVVPDVNTSGAVRRLGVKFLTDKSLDDLPKHEADVRADITFGNLVFISFCWDVCWVKPGHVFSSNVGGWKYSK